jgi:hypothetical protein
MPLIAACRALGVSPHAFESMAAASYSVRIPGHVNKDSGAM